MHYNHYYYYYLLIIPGSPIDPLIKFLTPDLRRRGQRHRGAHRLQPPRRRLRRGGAVAGAVGVCGIRVGGSAEVGTHGEIAKG